MADLGTRVQANVDAFRPHRTPPFEAVLLRSRARDRRRTVAAALLVAGALPAAGWAAVANRPGNDPASFADGPRPGAYEAAFTVHAVLDAAPTSSAPGAVLAPATAGGAAYPGGYSCGDETGFVPALDVDLVACTDSLPGELLLLGPARLGNEGIQAARVAPSRGGGGAVEVTLTLTDKGRLRYSEVIGEVACDPVGSGLRRVALLVDGTVMTTEEVDGGVPCGTRIRPPEVRFSLPPSEAGRAEPLAQALTSTRPGREDPEF